MNPFVEISLLLGVTTVVTILVRMLKQPLVIGYILSGIVVGPYLLDLLNAQHELELFSKVGIVFLLFIVGLHLNPKVIKEVGSVSLVTGLGQVFFTSVVGFIVSLLLGIDTVAAIYVSIALTFSSTIIILKLLADKRDLQKLYAKIAIGFLIVQDVVATLILIAITIFANQSGGNMLQTVAVILLKGLLVLILLILINSFLIRKLTDFLANSQELLFLFSLSWGVGLASLFLVLGFSIEIGALLAGVTLSTTPYADEISSRLKPLRDFFIIIFFILLGSQMAIANLGDILLPAIILSVFILIGNPAIVIVLMNLSGYSRRTGFMAGLTVAQISEFSLILASLGLQVGHLDQEALSLVTLVGLITIAGSTYLILYADKIYPKVARLLVILELIKKKQRDKGVVEEIYESVIFGFDRVGHDFVEVLEKIGESFLVVDYNPEAIAALEKLGLPHKYGDASDVEFLEELPLTKPRLVISTVPDLATNIMITKYVHKRNPRGIMVTIAQTLSEVERLYKAGATYVIMPHHLGAEYAAQIIRKCGTDKKAYLEIRDKHVHKLEKKYDIQLHLKSK